MINVATMTTNNVGLILGAFALNGLVWLVGVLVSLIEWLVLGALGLIATHWRIVASVAGLVAAVVLVALFWQVLLVGAGVLGGMYAGLKVVVSL